MGVVERKEREKEEMRAQILNAARKLFLERGIEATSIRNIAEMIEYSPGTIYLHFKDKDAILHELHHEGFLALGKQMRPLLMVTNPKERLMALGRVYIAFALENPEMYDLMFIKEAPIDFLCKRHQEEWNEGKATFSILRSTVQACMDEGHFADQELEPLSFMIWASAHGMVSLEIRKRTGGVSLINPTEVVTKGYEAMVKLLEK